MTSSTVACKLTDPELRARRETVLADFRAEQLEARPVEGVGYEGWAFSFAPGAQRLAALAELMDLERECCPFLTMRLRIEPDGGPVWIVLTGPAGTRQLLDHELRFVR